MRLESSNWLGEQLESSNWLGEQLEQHNKSRGETDWSEAVRAEQNLDTSIWGAVLVGDKQSAWQ